MDAELHEFLHDKLVNYLNSKAFPIGEGELSTNNIIITELAEIKDGQYGGIGIDLYIPKDSKFKLHDHRMKEIFEHHLYTYRLNWSVSIRTIELRDDNLMYIGIVLAASPRHWS